MQFSSSQELAQDMLSIKTLTCVGDTLNGNKESQLRTCVFMGSPDLVRPPH